MSLQDRIHQLERSSVKGTTPLCIFLVALRPDRAPAEIAPRLTAYSTHDQTWTRREDERPDEFKRRVVVDIEAAGRPTLITAHYQKDAV
jgi:hypothetical protein